MSGSINADIIPLFVYRSERITIHNKLPTEADFGGCLDARVAWRHFGDSTLDEAFVIFCANPLCYQEDFMFMGPVAFAYYFPVLDKYIRGVPDGNDFGDSEAWIIAKGITRQLHPSTADEVIHLADSISDLSNYVCDNIKRFGDNADQKRVLLAWREVSETLKMRTSR